MKVSIIYCAKCNFDPRVNNLTRALQENCGIEPERVGVDRRGTFDVAIDDQVVFSRERLGRLPRDREVVAYIKLMR